MDEARLETYALRPATAEDAPAVAEVLIAAGVKAWGPWLGAERVAGQTPPAERWVAAGTIVATTEAGELVGFVRTEPGEEGEGWVDLLYTHPRVWGRSAGRALLDAGLAELRAAGCATALLWTEERNERARHVYEAAGWHTDGELRERDWRGAQLRELRYRRDL